MAGSAKSNFPSADSRVWASPSWWLAAGIVAAALIVFRDGLMLLLSTWHQPEYAHGPLIPVISALLLHRQIARDGGPMVADGRATNWTAGALALVAVLLALFARKSGMHEVAAYGIVILAGAAVVAVLGWPVASRFWHPVLHLCFMLPLPGLLYYSATTSLQAFSSEAGVMFLRMFDIPVVLNGNVIDMGAVKLLVAEACSGLRYMYPVLSFSFVLAVLTDGPKWKKLAILAMAVPTAVAVNALRIAMIGLAYGMFGVLPSAGFAHYFEGWLVFLVSIGLILACAMALSPGGRLNLDTGIGSSRVVVAKLKSMRSTAAPKILAGVLCSAAAGFLLLPERSITPVDRVPFAQVQREVEEWTLRDWVAIDEATLQGLAADDVIAANFVRPGHTPPVELFMAYYADQGNGGIHSPQLCLPGAGWEIETLDTIHVDRPDGAPFPAMLAVIRRDLERRVVLYWFDQHGRRTAVDYLAKAIQLWDGATLGRTDGALVRLVSPVLIGETPAEARDRVTDFAHGLSPLLRPHLPPAEALL